MAPPIPVAEYLPQPPGPRSQAGPFPLLREELRMPGPEGPPQLTTPMTPAELVEELIRARRVPGAAYRVQLNKDFPFARATALVPYWRDLGITDLYVSPILQARPGSEHGYDTSDHGHVSAELGGEAGLAELTSALRAAGMGLLVDA